jgi:hypothetical protein
MKNNKLIASQPTTSCSTGWRAYLLTEDLLEIVYEGVPSNRCRTETLTREEAARTLAWQLAHEKEFAPIAEWISALNGR